MFKILVVEDDKNTAKLMKIAIGSAGYEVSWRRMACWLLHTDSVF
ncbi:hypothetical protein [Paenibacillus gallinarum]|nr:hypothetical protein [Paenibacillus gallinarum]